MAVIPPPPRVGVLHPCSGANAGPLFSVLFRFGYRFRTVSPDELAVLEPGEIDVLLLSGGWYFLNQKKLAPAGANLVRLVREHGLGAVGVCCGQINLCQLGLVPARLINMLGVGPTRIEPVRGDHPVLRGVAQRSAAAWRTWDPITILRWNGWLMQLEAGSDMVAAYDLDKTIAAIAVSQADAGRCVALSPHPEGHAFAAGELSDRDRLPIVFDGFAMGTARILDNALRWAAGVKLRPRHDLLGCPAKAAPKARGKSK